MQIEVSEDGFFAAVMKYNGGSAVIELDRELIKAVETIQDLGGSSTLTLKVGVSKIKSFEKAFNIVAEVAAKHPKEAPVPRPMFASAGNGLVEHMQKQDELPLSESVEPRKPTLISPIKENK